MISVSSGVSSIWLQLSSSQEALPAASIARAVRPWEPSGRPVSARSRGTGSQRAARRRGTRPVAVGSSLVTSKRRGRPLGRVGRAPRERQRRLSSKSVVQRTTTGVGSGVPEALSARTTASAARRAFWISQVPRLQSSQSLVSSLHSKRRGGRGAAEAEQHLAQRVDRPAGRRSRWCPARTGRSSSATGRPSRSCRPRRSRGPRRRAAPSPTVTDAGHAPQAPPSSRHSRRAGRVVDEHGEGRLGVAAARRRTVGDRHPGRGVDRPSPTPQGWRRRGCTHGPGPRSGGCRRPGPRSAPRPARLPGPAVEPALEPVRARRGQGERRRARRRGRRRPALDPRVDLRRAHDPGEDRRRRVDVARPRPARRPAGRACRRRGRRGTRRHPTARHSPSTTPSSTQRTQDRL